MKMQALYHKYDPASLTIWLYCKINAHNTKTWSRVLTLVVMILGIIDSITQF